MDSTKSLIPNDSEFDAIGVELAGRVRRRDRRIHRRAITAGAVGLVLVAGGISAGVVIANDATRTYVTYCYGAASTGSLSTQVGTGAEATDADGHLTRDGAGDAIEKCAAVWRIGFFANDGNPVEDGKTYSVPDLEACVRSDTVVAVLPRDGYVGDRFCQSVGLSQ